MRSRSRFSGPLAWLIVAAMVLGLVPPAVQAAPDDPIPASFFDLNSVGWLSQRNLSSSQFSTEFSKNAVQFMLIDMEVDGTGNKGVSGVWQKNVDGRGWESHRNLTGTEFAGWNSDLTAKGLRLIDQEAYTIDGANLYSGIWVQNVENLDWISYLDKNSDEFGRLFESYAGRGYMLIDFDAYYLGSSINYAAVWVQNSEGLSWYSFRDMTSAEFAAKFEELKGEFRILDVESYQIGGSQRYSAIWVQNRSGRGWVELRDLTKKEYADNWLRLRDQGYRLIDYESYLTIGGRRYAGVWRQNSDRPDWPLKANVDTLATLEWGLYGIPGMSVAVMQNGKVLYQRGFGYADVDDGAIAHAGTVYRIASVSKAVAGVLALEMQEQGDLNIDLPTRTYLPLAPSFHLHTVRQTLNNRSGLGHYPTYGSLDGYYANARTAAADLWDTGFVLPPGIAYIYSTHAYTFAGASMEAANGGGAIDDIYDSYLRLPFNLRTLRAENRSFYPHLRATLYDTDNDEVAADDQSWKWLGGGFESSVVDLARFGTKVVDGTILEPGSLTDLWTPPNLNNNYALGWVAGWESGTRVVAKDGANNGARSYLRMYPDKGIVIAVLTNRKEGGHDPRRLAKQIGALMLAAETNGPQPAAVQAVEELDEPQEETLPPEDLLVPVESGPPPSPSDLAEPAGDRYLDQHDLFLPLLLRP